MILNKTASAVSVGPGKDKKPQVTSPAVPTFGIKVPENSGPKVTSIAAGCANTSVSNLNFTLEPAAFTPPGSTPSSHTSTVSVSPGPAPASVARTVKAPCACRMPPALSSAALSTNAVRAICLPMVYSSQVPLALERPVAGLRKSADDVLPLSLFLTHTHSDLRRLTVDIRAKWEVYTFPRLMSRRFYSLYSPDRNLPASYWPSQAFLLEVPGAKDAQCAPRERSGLSPRPYSSGNSSPFSVAISSFAFARHFNADKPIRLRPFRRRAIPPHLGILQGKTRDARRRDRQGRLNRRPRTH